MKRVVLLALVGCAHTDPAVRAADLERSLHAIDPNAEPAPPQAPPNGPPAFNTEYYLGSAAAESQRFAEFGKQIQAIQKATAEKKKQPVQRGFHAKGHACLRGTFALAAYRPERAKFGVFADATKPKPVWVRFSNGVGWKQGDSSLDARGMAVKVMGVPGPKYLPDEASTQDFLMTNTPTPVGRDAEEFMKFAHANLSGRIAGVFFLIGHPVSAAPALLRTAPVDSMITTQYWSGSAYHLGAHQAVKFTAKPCDPTLKRKPDRDSDHYLRHDLQAAAKEGICMRFFVQFQVDPEQTPIENASKEWDEELSRPQVVGDIRLPPQDVDSPEALAACDQLSFSPWHSIPQHKPMGHINRARKNVYYASKSLRHGGGEPKP